jgi:SAM-dependent methyltransferase
LPVNGLFINLGFAMGVAERIFDAFMYPFEALTLSRRRRKLLRQASGRVLEIGAGTGANLPFYPWNNLESLHLSDLKLTEDVKRFHVENGSVVHLLEAPAENLPFPAQSFDTVVSTLVFCSVDDPARGYNEIRRVLKPGGRLLFIEHVSPRRQGLRWITEAAHPIWLAINRSCHLNRNTLETIRRAGFLLPAVHAGIGGMLISGIAVSPAQTP